MKSSFEETLDYLYSRLPVFQHIGKAAYKADLYNTKALLRATGNPENGLRCIHIAGTNGKGSVSSLLASVFTSHGYKTGLYTSPHLKDFRERIRIDGKKIEKQEVVDFTSQIKPAIEEISPSFFEVTVAMAFDYFRKHETDMTIIETGMGGRLDSTNTVTPVVSVITNIGMDHMEFLGDTPEKIAAEKAGIIKPGIPVVIGEAEGPVLRVFEQRAGEMNSPLHLANKAPEDWIDICPLKGAYQRKNLATLKCTLDVLSSRGFEFNEELILTGIRDVIRNTGIRGRWEVIGNRPMVIADTAHNEHGLKEVLAQIQTIPHQNLHFVLGAVNDKDLSKILPLFPDTARYYFCKPNVVRGLDAGTLMEKASAYGLKGSKFSSVNEAVGAARSLAEADDLIYIGGSTFVVAEALPDQSEA